MGVTIILKFSQRNGELPLPRPKQGNHPVITIYDTEFEIFILGNNDHNDDSTVREKKGDFFTPSRYPDVTDMEEIE